MTNTELIEEDIATAETAKLTAQPRSKGAVKLPLEPPVAVPMLEFPRLYIVGPVVIGLGLCEITGDDGLGLIPDEPYCFLHRAVYNLETVPALVFDAWLREIMSGAKIETWIVAPLERLADIGERWYIINELAERGVTLPLYDNMAAAQEALKQGGRA